MASGLGRYLALRAVNSVIVIIAVVLLTLIMFGPLVDQQLKAQIEMEVRQQILKGGAFGKYKTPEEAKRAMQKAIEERIKALGLDKPWYIRIWGDLWRTLTFDLGTSWVIKSDSGSSKVVNILLERIPRTVLLFGTSTIILLVLQLLLGAKAAATPGSLFDRVVVLSGLLGYAFATWWVGMVLLYLFAYLIPIFPAGGMVSVPPPQEPLRYALDLAWHMFLPVLTILIVALGGWAYVTRNLMIGILTEDYITTSRAKGVPERKVIYYHALKMAAPPILTQVTLAIASIFTGGLLTEIVFSWPGMGLLYWDAILSLDIPVIMGDVYFTTILIVLANLTADLLYGIVDPRIRLGAGGATL